MRNKNLIKLLLKKDKLVSILLTIEFICIFILFYNVQKDFKLVQSINSVQKYEWNQKGTYSLGIASSSIFDNKNTSENDVVKFYNDIKAYQNIEFVGLSLSQKVTTQWLKGNYKKDIYTPYSVNSSIELDDSSGSSFLSMPIRVCDSDYLKVLGISTDNMNTTNDNNRSIILGSKFKDIYNIGDSIKLDSEGKINFIVKDFFEKNTAMTYSKDYFDEYPFIDNSLVILLNENDLINSNLIREILLLNTMNIKFIDGNYEKFKSDIIKLGEKNNLRISITDNQKNLSTEVEKLNSQINFSLLRTIVFLIAAFCSAIGTIIYSIYEFKKELGIAIVLGATKLDIFIINTVKIFLVGTLGYILATILNYSGFINICGNGWYIIQSNLNDFILTFFAFLIVLILVSLYPLIRILRINVANLIGGKD